MAEITPSVGRKVWYFEEGVNEDGAPWDATVIKVCGAPWTHSPFSAVNLLVTSPDDGQQFFVPNVLHSPTPNGSRRYTWMPYQRGQAEKESAAQSANRIISSGQSWSPLTRADIAGAIRSR